MFKEGGNRMAVLGWLVRLLNASFDMGVAPMEWRGASIFPCAKGGVISVNMVTREILVC